MAGEIFIAQQNTLEEVKSTVNGIDTNIDIVNTTTSETKTQTTNIKSDIDGLKLSTDSINQIADAILEKIGLTTDVGGINTGTVFGKLNALFSSGGGISGFKYTQLAHIYNGNPANYTTSSFGIVIGERTVSDSYTTKISVDNAHGSVIEIYTNQSNRAIIGFFSSGATITVEGYQNKGLATAYIFEFI